MVELDSTLLQMDIPAKIEFIISSCKGSFTLSFNEHKDCYKTVQEYLKTDYIDNNILEEMIGNDTIINIIFYPDSPVGYYNLYHYDLNKILDLSITLLFKGCKHG